MPHRFHTPATGPVRRLRVSGWLLGCLALGACQSTPPPAPRSSPEALLLQISAEIGDAHCDQDSQCRSLPVGHKACGGPQGHLAWSALVSQEERLLALAQQHQQAVLAAQEKSGRMSDCMLVTDPGARCAMPQKRCELNPSGRAGQSLL